MSKKQLALILGALVIAGTYWLLTSDHFTTPPLEIAYKVVPQRSTTGRGTAYRIAPRRGGGVATTNQSLVGRLANAVASAGSRGAGSRGGPGRAGGRTSPTATTTEATDPLFFSFDRKLTLDWVKVYPVSDLETNRELPHVVWEIIATTNPVPTKGILYGNAPEVLGMRLAVAGFDAEPLEPGVKYRMFLSANDGSIKAHRDFVAPETP